MRLLPWALRAAVLCAAPATLVAQTPAAQEPGAQIRVALVTIGPGAKIYDRFGHNAIWVQDPDRGIDLLYNYGTYDFNAENFVLRFVQGRMLYRLASGSPENAFRFYRSINRSMWVQELNLTPAQRIEVRDFLLWNDLPENRDYRYDYYYDNCSTRVRDVLDRALGGLIQQRTGEHSIDATFRFHTQRLTTNNPLYYTGLMIALGPMVDRPITAWDEMFLPMSLRDRLRDITVPGPDGSPQPLVVSESTLFESTARPAGDEPPSWLPAYLVVGIVLAGILIWLGQMPGTGRARVGFAGVATLWMAVVGVLGTVLFGMVTLTDHASAYWNENLFLFNPFALGLAATLPFLAAGFRWSRRPAVFLAVAVMGLSVVGLVAQVLPWLDQVNGQLYGLVLLPNLAAGLGTYRLANADHVSA
jgi:hypothetical protein